MRILGSLLLLFLLNKMEAIPQGHQADENDRLLDQRRNHLQMISELAEKYTSDKGSCKKIKTSRKNKKDKYVTVKEKMNSTYLQFMGESFLKNACELRTKQYSPYHTMASKLIGFQDAFDDRSTFFPETDENTITTKAKDITKLIKTYGLMNTLGMQESHGNAGANAHNTGKYYEHESGIFQISVNSLYQVQGAKKLVNNNRNIVFKDYVAKLSEIKNEENPFIKRQKFNTLCKADNFNGSEYWKELSDSHSDELALESYKKKAEGISFSNIDFKKFAYDTGNKKNNPELFSTKAQELLFGNHTITSSTRGFLEGCANSNIITSERVVPSSIEGDKYGNFENSEQKDKAQDFVSCFRALNWACPAMSADITALNIRLNYKQHGPLKRKLITSQCEDFFTEIYNELAEKGACNE